MLEVEIQDMKKPAMLAFYQVKILTSLTLLSNSEFKYDFHTCVRGRCVNIANQIRIGSN